MYPLFLILDDGNGVQHTHRVVPHKGLRRVTKKDLLNIVQIAATEHDTAAIVDRGGALLAICHFGCPAQAVEI